MKTKYLIILTLYFFAFSKPVLGDSIDYFIEKQDSLGNFSYFSLLTYQQAAGPLQVDESSDPEDADNSTMGFIRQVEIVAIPCRDWFLFVNRFVGKSTAEDKYFNVTINPRALTGYNRVNLVLKMSTRITIDVDPSVAAVRDLGQNTYRIMTSRTTDRLRFVVHGFVKEPFPEIREVTINRRPVCLHVLKWDPQESDPVPLAVSSALVPPTRFIPRCGRKQVDHTPLIINGEPTKPGDWPWHAALLVTEARSQPPRYQCGGSVVSRNAVLTAAHCVMSNGRVITLVRIKVVLGKYNLYLEDDHSKMYGVQRVQIHPNFDADILRNDFALLFTKNDIEFNEFVQPVCLWDQTQVEKNILYGEFGSVVGWGTNEGDELSEQLTTGRMRVVPDNNCVDSLPNFFSKYLTDNSFCAGNGPDNLTSACNGDSGGGFAFPITMSDGRVTWFLRGVVSLSVLRHPSNLCDPRHHIVIADAASQADWLYTETGIAPYDDASRPVKEDVLSLIPKRTVSPILQDIAQHIASDASKHGSFD